MTVTRRNCHHLGGLDILKEIKDPHGISKIFLNRLNSSLWEIRHNQLQRCSSYCNALNKIAEKIKSFFFCQ